VKFLSKAFLLCVVCSGEDLSDLAVEHSICPSKDEGGMLGWVRKGQMVCCCLGLIKLVLRVSQFVEILQFATFGGSSRYRSRPYVNETDFVVREGYIVV